MNKVFTSLLFCALIVIAGVGCASAQTTATSLTPVTVTELDASGARAYYSLRTNQTVPDSLKDSEAWDIAFQGTTIAFNTEAQIVDVAFDSLAAAPEDGYRVDGDEARPPIPSGNGEGWYVYDSTTHVVEPMTARTIVLRTPEGTYAKVEIVSYYQDGMPGVGAPRYYTFRYVHQPDGSRRF